MSDFDSVADRMYPSSAPAPAPAPTASIDPPRPAVDAASVTPPVVPDPASPDRAAEEPDDESGSLLPAPDEIMALRNSPERRMFNATIRADIKSLYADDASEATAEMRGNLALETARIVDDLGLTESDVSSMRMAARSIAETYTPESFASMEVDAISALRSEFGDQTEVALAAAQKLVARDGRVKDFLLRTGLGSDPQTVVRFARLAMGRR